MDLYNTHPGLALPFPFIREPREGYCLANNCFILAVPPDNALIGLPQLSKISRPLPGETEMQGEQLPAAQRPCRRETGAGGPGHGQAGPPPGPTGPGLGATPPPQPAPGSEQLHPMWPVPSQWVVSSLCFFTSVSDLNIAFQPFGASTGTRFHPGPSRQTTSGPTTSDSQSPSKGLLEGLETEAEKSLLLGRKTRSRHLASSLPEA